MNYRKLTKKTVDKEAESIVKLLPISFAKFDSNIFTQLGTVIRINLLDNQAKLALKEKNKQY